MNDFFTYFHVDDSVSKWAAGAGSGVGGLYAVSSSSLLETLVGAAAMLLVPVVIAAVNRMIDKRFHEVALKAALTAAEATVAQLKAELAERKANEAIDAVDAVDDGAAPPPEDSLPVG